MITRDQFDILTHTSRTGRFVSDCQTAIQLGKDGFLRDFGPQRIADGMHYLVLTEKGREAMAEFRATLPTPKPLTRSQERWQRFLIAQDAWGCTFREFLASDR